MKFDMHYNSVIFFFTLICLLTYTSCKKNTESICKKMAKESETVVIIPEGSSMSGYLITGYGKTNNGKKISAAEVFDTESRLIFHENQKTSGFIGLCVSGYWYKSESELNSINISIQPCHFNATTEKYYNLIRDINHCECFSIIGDKMYLYTSKSKEGNNIIILNKF